jgi:hypothetical protein
LLKNKYCKKLHSSQQNHCPRSPKTAKEHPQKPAQECPLSRGIPILTSSSSLLPSFLKDLKTSNLADSNIRSLVDTSLGRTFTESRRLLVVVVGTLVFLADVLDRLGTCLGDSGSVAIVAVDTDEVLSVGSLDVVDDDLSSTADLETHVSDFDRGKEGWGERQRLTRSACSFHSCGTVFRNQ